MDSANENVKSPKYNKKNIDKNKKINTKDIDTWAKDLKHNENTANKYKGVKTVEDILRIARNDGYNFTKKELLNFNLDKVAGGLDFGFDLDFDFGDKTSTSTKTTTTQQSKNITIQNANVKGDNNYIEYHSNTEAKQS